MSTTASESLALSSISDVERDTGVAKETLRVWERRYAFPQPLRDPNGERIYPAEQVQRLRLVKRLLDQGYRPGKIMHLDSGALAELASKRSAPAPAKVPNDPELLLCLDLLKAHQMHELRQRMAQAQLQMGLKAFVTEVVAPLTQLVGDAWAAGEVAVFEEHLYSEMLQSVMRNAIFAATQHTAYAAARPRILLTTVPLERHGLGLLMAEAMFALEGAHCVSLGVQTPLAEIVDAARIQKADIVALSFSSMVSARAVLDNVSELRNRLGDTTEVWSGGAGALAVRRQLGPDSAFDLDEIGPGIAAWQEQRKSALPA
jgi:DNA-binding transcriptional MerR regulator